MRFFRGTMVCVLVLGMVLLIPMALAEEFSGHAKCKLCHSKAADGEQWVVWSKMKHKNTFALLKTPEALEVGKAKGLEKPPSESPECLQCHLTGYDIEKKAAPANLKPEDGVQCESCHGVTGPTHQSWGMKAKMGKAEEGADKGTRKGTEEDCLKCHNDKNPTWNPEKYTNEKGEKVGFDYKQAFAVINHNKPE